MKKWVAVAVLAGGFSASANAQDASVAALQGFAEQATLLTVLAGGSFTNGALAVATQEVTAQQYVDGLLFFSELAGNFTQFHADNISASVNADLEALGSSELALPGLE